MSVEIVSALAFGLLIGVAVGWWRCMVYCRKLTHFGINLDQWAHYDPVVEQARTAEGPAPRMVAGPGL